TLTLALQISLIGQWQRANGPRLGNISALAVSGSNVFAGATSGIGGGAGTGGAFLSTNNGATWVSRSTGIANDGITALALNGSNLFAGGAESGIYVTSNNGTQWREVVRPSTVVFDTTFMNDTIIV